MHKPRALTLGLALALTTLTVLAVVLTATAAAQARSAAVAPSNTVTPAVAGSTQVGSTLTATTGTWSGDTPITYATTWLRCNASGNACTGIAGATTATYLITIADLAATLRVSVVAVNAAGAAGAVTAPTAAVTSSPSAPANAVAPTLSGSARQGQTLSVANGTWSSSSSITYTYQWKRCDAAGQSCSDASAVIPQSSITLAAADVGKTIRAVVIATTTSGAASATSAPSTTVVSTNAPVSTGLPTVSGIAREGDVLTAATGTWGGAGLTYTYTWRRCDTAGQNCADASAAITQNTITLAAADVGKTIRVLVTATSSGGTATATSDSTDAVVKKDAPVATAAPSISGQAREGQALTVAPGTWSGTGTTSFTFQWKRCDSAGLNCTDASSVIPQSSITLTASDVGTTLRTLVIATNAAGSASTLAPATAIVVAKDAPAPAGPTGADALPTGTGTLAIAQIVSPNRLVLATATPTPGRISSRGAFVLSVKVTDLKGRPVEGAVVAALPLPTAWAKGGSATTGADGRAAITIRPTAKLPLTPGTLSVFLQATRTGDDKLLKVTGSRLAQIRIG